MLAVSQMGVCVSNWQRDVSAVIFSGSFLSSSHKSRIFICRTRKKGTCHEH